MAWLGYASPGLLSAADAPSTLPVLQSVRGILELAPAEAQRGYPVRLQGVVVFVGRPQDGVFLMDSTATMRINGLPQQPALGDLIVVEGETILAYAPEVRASRMEKTGTAPLPAPAPVTREILLTGDQENQWRELTGMATGIQFRRSNTHITFTVAGGHVDTYLHGTNHSASLTNWLHKQLTVTGVVRTMTNQAGQLVGAFLRIPSADQVWVSSSATDEEGVLTLTGAEIEATDKAMAQVKGLTNPPAEPVRRISAELLRYRTSSRKVRAVGTVILTSRSTRLYCADGSGPLRVNLRQPEVFNVGEKVEITGYPFSVDYRIWLNDAEVHRLGQGELPPPVRLTSAEATKARWDSVRLTLKGRVVGYDGSKVNRTARDGLFVRDDTGVFRVNFDPGSHPWERFPVGSLGEFTGLGIVDNLTVEGGTGVSLFVSLPADAQLLADPPYWTPTRIGVLAGVFGTIALFAAGWIILQRRQFRLLRASEEKFRAVIEHSFDITVVIDPAGVVRYINPTGLRLLGSASRPGTPWSSGLSTIIVPEDLPLLEAARRAVLTQSRASHRVASCRVRAADGSVRSIEAIGTNCLDVPGVEGVAVNIRDVTERRRAEQKLERAALVQQRINEFATSLSPLHTEADILWEITRQCISVLGFVDCVIYLADESHHLLVQRAAFGPKNPRDREILSPIEIPFGRGIVGSVAVSGQPEIIADTRQDPRYLLDDAPRLSEISVPIVAGDRVLGVIDSEHPEAGFFNEDHLAVLVSIASLCANKLVRARAEVRLHELNAELEQRIEQRTAELRATNEQLQAKIDERAHSERIQKALYQISEAVHTAEDLPSLYARIHSIVATLMPAENFYLALYDRASHLLTFPYHRDKVDPPPPPRALTRGMTEYVLRTGRPTLADWEEVARLKAAGEYEQTGHPSRIWLGVPLISQGRPFGVMAVQDHFNPQAFQEREKQLLAFVAEQTALAIERKRAEAEVHASAARLRESEERFSKAFHASPIILGIARLSDGRFLDVNETFLAALGRRREEVIGHTSLEVGIWSSQAERDAFVEALRVHGQIRNREFPLLKGGETRTLLMSAELIVIGSEPCVVSVSADITERHQAEVELLRTLARERELSQLKSRFVATISHEFRTPLGILLSSADILQRYFDRLTPAQRSEHLRDIQECAVSMSHQMENVLMFGRAEANRLECHPVPIDLPALCTRLIQQAAAAHEHRCPIHLQQPESFPTVQADEALLSHVLNNLLSNAIKYSSPGQPVLCELTTEREWVVVRVRDHGVGIPPADLPHLFTPFQRGSNVSRIPGTGMGLTIVKRCLEIHGGEVRVESAEHQGTTVTVRWRGVAANSEKPSSPPTACPPAP